MATGARFTHVAQVVHLVSRRRLARIPQVFHGDCVGKISVVIVTPCVGVTSAPNKVEVKCFRTPPAPLGGSRVAVSGLVALRYVQAARDATEDDPFPFGSLWCRSGVLDQDFQGDSLLQLRATRSKPSSCEHVCILASLIDRDFAVRREAPDTPRPQPASSSAALTAAVASRSCSICIYHRVADLGHDVGGSYPNFDLHRMMYRVIRSSCSPSGTWSSRDRPSRRGRRSLRSRRSSSRGWRRQGW